MNSVSTRQGGDWRGWSHGKSPRGKACQGCRFLPFFPAVGQRWSCPLLPNNLPWTREYPSSLLGGRTEWLPRRRQAWRTQRKEKKAGWADRMGRSGAPGQQWKNKFAHILGGPQDSKALSVFVIVSQSLTLARPQGTRLFRAPSPSMCPSHFSQAERWVPFALFCR